MRKTLFIKFFLLLVFQATMVFSQNYNSLNDDQKQIHQMLQAYHTAGSDSLKCVAAFKLAMIYYKNNQPKIAKLYLKRANTHIKENSYLKDLSFYYNHAMQPLPLSDEVKPLQDFQDYYTLANQKLKKYQNPQVYAIRSTILFNLALVYQRRNNDFEATKILINEALPVARKANDPVEIANIYRFLGLIFYNKDDNQNATYYVDLAIKTLEKNPVNHENYSEDLLQFYLFYVEILSQEQHLDLARTFLKKAQNILDLHPQSNLILDFYSAQGNLLHQSKDYRAAVAVFKKGLQKAQQQQDAYSVLNFKLLQFESLKGLKDFNAAKDLLLEVLSDPQVNIEDQKTYAKELASIYEKLHDFPNALVHAERYIELSDSLEAVSGKTEIVNLEARFKNKENERRIKALEMQQQQASLTAKYNRLNYIVFMLISFILFLAALFLIKNAKSQERIADQKEINYQQNLEALQTQKELEVMQASIKGEEAERQRIARDLQDGIGSRLSVLKSELGSIHYDAAQRESFESLSASLTQSITELRRVAFNLMPEALLKLGLELALKDLCYSLRSEKCNVIFTAHQISESIKNNEQVTIFRIVQELINNALKHSGATEIKVDCRQTEQFFTITVADNGKGFPSDDLSAYSGLGLKNIKNRIDLLQGKFEIDSQLGTGAVFNIELILQGHEQ